LQNTSIQIKTLSKSNTVILGHDLNGLISDYFLICVRNFPDDPLCYVLKTSEVKTLARKSEKKGSTMFWLQRSEYETVEYKEKWERIGHGVELCKKSNQ
jgi:hypothetical protein